ncbi:aldo/keto reductase [Streptomyces sp. NPDC001508]|uniref:aldo/keto reductase n=1 Tax=Streptomyces sp. NPDC001508 TaxID=3154656 RepID=UPI00332BB3D5
MIRKAPEGPVFPAREDLGSVGGRLGVGTALFGAVNGDDAEAQVAAIVRTALERGVRYFDTAPLYCCGDSESRLGAALASHDRSGVVVSTKVGYVVGDDNVSITRDFSRDGVLSSLDASLERLRTDYVDIVYIHDPDHHATEALGSAYDTLDDLRRQGVVRAIGVGINQTELATRFVRETDIDLVLLAGRYTLLDRSATQELLPACQDRGVSVVAAGVFNSGVLATGKASSTYDYRRPDDAIMARVALMKSVCDRYGVPLRAGALQFPGRHPAAVATLVGVVSVAELTDDLDMAGMRIPGELWDELDALDADGAWK